MCEFLKSNGFVYCTDCKKSFCLLCQEERKDRQKKLTKRKYRQTTEEKGDQDYILCENCSRELKNYNKETLNSIQQGYFRNDRLYRLTAEKEEQEEREAIESLKDSKGLELLHLFYKEQKIEDLAA